MNPPDAGAPPIPTPASTPTNVLQPALQAILHGNWLGAARIAAAMLLTAGVSATVLGLMFKPDDFGFVNTLTLVAILTTSALGGRAFVEGSFQAEGEGGSLTASLGVMPLTLTLATLFVGFVVFRRVTGSNTHGLRAWGDGLRASVILALAMMLVSLVFRSGNDDLGVPGLNEAINGLGVDGSTSLSIGAGAVSSFFLPLVLSATFFGLVTLTRPDWWGPRMNMVSRWASTPLRALGALALLLPAAGVVMWLVLLLGKSGNDVEGIDSWLSTIAGCIAYAGNAGVFLITLGAAGSLGASVSAGFAGSESEFHALASLAGDFGDEPGLWIAVVVTPLWLAAGLGLLTRRQDADGVPATARARQVMVWLGTFVVFLVLLLWGANAHFSFSTHSADSFGADSFGGEAASGVGGAHVLRAVVLLTLYAGVLAAGLALRNGWITVVSSPQQRS